MSDTRITARVVEAFEVAFRDVAPFILANAGQIAFKDKSDGTPVTEIDVEAEKRIFNSVHKLFPDIDLRGEESGYDENNIPQDCWLIDPIDGTKSFIENTGSFTSMAVQIVDGQAVASIIYDPGTDEMFTAIKGQGAYKNGQKLDLGSQPLQGSVLCKEKYRPEIDRLYSEVGVVSQEAPHGAGYSFTKVAEGLAAARISINSGGYVHDYATGALLVAEAGGVIIPVHEAEYTISTKSFIVCHPALADVTMSSLDSIRDLEAAFSKK